MIMRWVSEGLQYKAGGLQWKILRFLWDGKWVIQEKEVSGKKIAWGLQWKYGVFNQNTESLNKN